jgi:hypothetical protein
MKGTAMKEPRNFRKPNTHRTAHALWLASAIVTILTISLTRASAWWADGHELIAAVAYQELTPAEQGKVNGLLAQHPQFPTWSGGGTSSLEIFMKASTWADEIRNYNDPSTRANWHFIDYKLKPKSYPFRPDLNPTDNAVVGISQLVVWLDDPHLAAAEQAKNLAFLIHFVGDIHQPLHCECLFNTTFASYADGDRGGNRFYVHTNSTTATNTKLHSLWDSFLGDQETLSQIEGRVLGIINAHPRSEFAARLTKTDPKDWSLESRAFAVTQGYKPLSALNGTTAHAVTLPSAYIADAVALSESQAALAAYRLADLLKSVLAANP